MTKSSHIINLGIGSIWLSYLAWSLAMSEPSPLIKQSVGAMMTGVVIGVCGTIIVGCTAYLWTKEIKNSLMPKQKRETKEETKEEPKK